jgi:hypothetical protein
MGGWSQASRAADGGVGRLSRSEARRLLLCAIELAGLHEAIALTHCALSWDELA